MANEDTDKDLEDIKSLLSGFVETHKQYLGDLKGHKYGAEALVMARATGSHRKGATQQQMERDHDHEADALRTETQNKVRVGVQPETGLGVLLSSRIDDHVPKSLHAMPSISESMSFIQTEVTSSKAWWQNPMPQGATGVTYGASQGYWRCDCQGPQWTCSNKMSCLASEITEEDRLREEAYMEGVAKATGVMPESKLKDRKFHPRALDCIADSVYTCIWSRDCDCEMPWLNVPECRPLRKVAPQRCPVKCDKNAWPWNWVCTRYCWCPGCESPYCAWYFWFTLVCRRFCECEAQCPESPITEAE